MTTATLKERLVFSSPSTGDPVGLSYMQPRTMKDLEQRRTMMETWASVHHGFLGRAPDYMNTAIMAYASASNLIMIPQEKDFNTDIHDQLDRYMKSIDLNAKKSVQLARLAWEISVSSFGGRQSVYERFFFGNSTVVNNRLYAEYQDSRAKYADRVNRFLT
ncbi:4-hydroxyphenylacetate 3-hydroxylase C-terminal domain-containing protein [Paenibacillus alvei]|nr:4-hydroxyphenylacetate 3-hydroxylase C-terminal domain-containing protein [Paenibacillus alvei]